MGTLLTKSPHPDQHRRQCRQPSYLVPARHSPLLDEESRTLDKLREPLAKAPAGYEASWLESHSLTSVPTTS